MDTDKKTATHDPQHDATKNDPKHPNPQNQDPKQHEAMKHPTNQDPKHQEAAKQPVNQNPTYQGSKQHDPVHDQTKDDAGKGAKSKTATGGSKE